MKKNCLLILPRELFPVVYGYAIHRKNLIEILNRHYRLSIVIISRKEISLEEKQFYENNSFYFNFVVIQKWKYLLNAFLGIFSSYPIQVCFYYFEKVQIVIDKLLQDQDIVIGSLIRTMKYLDRTPEKCKIIFDAIDSIGLNYSKSSKNVSSIFWRLIYHIETVRLLNYEKHWVERAYATMFFNKYECDYWRMYGDAILLPHGVNSVLFCYNKIETKYNSYVSFIGKMNYQPNVDAVLWYINNVHLRICDKVPFIIVGAYPTNRIFNAVKKERNITVTGFIDDPFLIINSSALLIAPMQTGAGIQNKVLESMALGKINIITSLAAKPIIGGIDGEHFLVADTADEYCDKIIDVITYPCKYEKIGINAQNFIKMNYTWENYETKYISVLKKDEII
jgi:glycosyltransferase involved in cell wall biosynthesis